jgi:lipopolysaccharide biosynthesis glycosyltransferase
MTSDAFAPLQSARQIFLCSDAGYVVPLAVTLRSLAESQTSRAVTKVTVMSLGIGSEDQQRIVDSTPGLDVRFVPIEDRLPADVPTVGRLNRATYGRLLAVDLLPQDVKRVVYLDADLIVREDLSPLFDADLGTSPIAAVQSATVPHVSNPYGLAAWRSLELAPDLPYLNSGVLVIDTDRWRQRDLGRAVLDFVARHRDELHTADQDGFNGVLRGDFARLELRWNQEATLREPSHFAYTAFDRNEVDEAINNPAIIHFTGADKPWKQGCRDTATAEWRALLGRTDYRNVKPEPPSARQRLVRLGKRLLR